jgi:PAS domain S-box-containing protein
LVLLAIFLLAGLWFAHQVILPHTRERDLDRLALFTSLSRLVLESDAARGVQPEVTLGEIRDLGLADAEILPVAETPAGRSPRYITPGSHVEAWEVFRGPDGQPAGIIRLQRWNDTTRWVLGVLQAMTAVLVGGGLLLILATSFSACVPSIRQIRSLTQTVREKFGLPASSAGPSRDAVQELALSIDEAAAQTLSEADRRQCLLDGHEEAACFGTADGTLLEVNAAYARMFGRSQEELTGTNYLDLIPPADRTEVVNGLQKLTPRHPTNTETHRVFLPDGKIRWTRWRDRALFDEQGDVNEILSFGLDVTEEQNLRDEIERLRLAFDQMQSLARTGSLTWNFSEDRMAWTDETFRLLEIEREDSAATLDRLIQAVVPDDREHLRHLFQRARENGDPFECEFRAVLPDGAVRVLQSRAEVTADPKTKLLNQLTCTLRDITALRDAEAATKRELRFREAIEQSLAAGISVSDDRGRILLVNPAFSQMTGWSPEELIGATAPYPYWPEEEMAAINAAFEQAIRGETPPQGFELKFRRKDGTRFDVLVKVAPLLDVDDKQLGWLGAVTDITAIQQTRRDLLATNERLRIAQAVAEFGIWDWDPIDDTLQWDRQSFAIFGHPAATDPQEVWGKIHSREEQERLTYVLRRLIAAGATSGQDRIRAKWADGTIHEILSTYTILRDENGRATRVLGINRDVTAEVEEERQLRDANERLAAALEGGQFGTFEHVVGVGDLNWSAANYEINGINPSVTEPSRLFELWKQGTGSFFPELMARMQSLPVGENHLTYEFTAHPPRREPRRIRSSVFIERNKQGHPVRLVGITRRLD